MKLLFKIILFSALIMGFAGEARAEFRDGQQIPAEIIRPLMSWVEQNVGVRVPVLPKVIASRTYLLDVVGGMGRTAGRAKAVYAGGMVILDHRRFDETDSHQLSLLVHELVHYAQSFKRHQNLGCPQAKEQEAYTLQNRWLEEKGSRPYVRASWIRRMASCSYSNGGVDIAMAR